MVLLFMMEVILDLVLDLARVLVRGLDLARGEQGLDQGMVGEGK